MQARRLPPPAARVIDPSDLPWRRCDAGIVIRFRLTPRSSRTAVDGVGVTADGPAVLARVNAVPEDNAANLALTGLVADWLQCPKRDIALVGGAKSRIKSVAVAGDPDALGRCVAQKLAAMGSASAISGEIDAPVHRGGATTNGKSKG